MTQERRRSERIPATAIEHLLLCPNTKNLLHRECVATSAAVSPVLATMFWMHGNLFHYRHRSEGFVRCRTDESAPSRRLMWRASRRRASRRDASAPPDTDLWVVHRGRAAPDELEREQSRAAPRHPADVPAGEDGCAGGSRGRGGGGSSKQADPVSGRANVELVCPGRRLGGPVHLRQHHVDADDLVALALERQADGTADEAGRAGEQHSHGTS